MVLVQGDEELSSSDTKPGRHVVFAEWLLPLPPLSLGKSALEGSFPYQCCLFGGLAPFITLTLKALEAFDAASLYSESNSKSSPCQKLPFLGVGGVEAGSLTTQCCPSGH